MLMLGAALLTSCYAPPLEGRWQLRQAETIRYDAAGRELSVDREQPRNHVVELTPTTLRLYEADRLLDEQPYERDGAELRLLRAGAESQRIRIEQLTPHKLRWQYDFKANNGNRQVVNEELIRQSR